METWLYELGISTVSAEENFSSGYLLGSILYRYNLQEDFGTFSSKGSYAESNLYKVQQSLERVGIRFCPDRVEDQEPGYIQTVLEKLFRTLHTQTSRPVRGKTASSKVQRIKPEAPSYSKFESVRLQQSEKALKEEKKQSEAIRQFYLQERQKQIDILKSNKVFMQQWEQDGKTHWKANQLRKTTRVSHEKQVAHKLSSERLQQKAENNRDHLVQVLDGISEFERNMIRLGIDHVPDSKEVRKKKLDIKTEAMITMAKIKERKDVNMQATKERDVRQRNLIVEQKKNEKFDLYKKSSSKLAGVLVKLLKERYSFAWAVTKKHSKKMKGFQESARNIEAIMRMSQGVWGKIEGERRDKLNIDEQEKKKRLLCEKQKFSKSFLNERKELFEDRLKRCSTIMDLILEVADEGFKFLQDSEKIPERTWENWMALFKDNRPPSYKDPMTSIARTNDMQEVIKHTFIKTPNFDQVLVNSYLEGNDIWKFSDCKNNFLLGDIVETVLPIAYPDDPDPALPEGPHYMPLKVILIGPAFSGKKTQIKKLQEQFGLKQIEVQKLIEEAKKVLERKADAEDPKKKKVAEEEPEVFVSAALETLGQDEFGRSRLIRARLRGLFGDVARAEEEVKKGKKEEVKCSGFCLVNYPNNIEEAADLERHMSNFIHPSERPEPLSVVKKREALIIARPSVKPPAPKKMFRSAWDLVIVLDVDLNTCVTRAVDRRVDPAGNIYNMTYYPPPDNLLQKCKVLEHPNAAEVTEMYSSYSETKDTLIHWFSQFGHEYTTSLLVIKGNSNIETASELIKNKINWVFKVRNEEPKVLNEEINVIKIEQARILADEWERLRESYLGGLGFNLGYLELHLEDFLETQREIQSEFLRFLGEGDDKLSLFSECQGKINSAISSKGVFTSTEIGNLDQSIDDIVDQLWDVTVKRKDSAISKRKEIMNSLILTQQLAGLMHLVCALLQVEIEKYYRIVNFVEHYYSYLGVRQYVERTIPQLLVNWHEWPFKLIGLPLLKDLCTKAKGFALKLTEHSPETFNFETRIENIYEFAKRRVEKYERSLDDMFDVLDRWIKEVVKLENSAINEGAKVLKNTISARLVDEEYKFPENKEILSNLIDSVF